MKTIEEFLSYLRSLDVKLWADGDRLRYSAPEGTLTPTLRAEVVERKAEILTFLHKVEHVSRSTIPPIQPVPRDGDLPLSFAQQRLWFLDQLEGSSAIYNMPAALHLIGVLHVAALEQSLNEFLRRHEALRTNFVAINGQLAQVITPTFNMTMPTVDLHTLPEGEQPPEVWRLATEEAHRPFNLANGLLLRVTLLRLGEESHVLLVTMHHIVSDGWSIGIFIREVATLYKAFSTGAPSPLPELPIQYADFAHWQRQWLSGEVLETQLNYWKQQLANAPPLLELPTDRPRPPVQTFRGASQSLVLSKTLSEALNVLSSHEGVTLFMTLLAAFKTLLYSYTGQKDIIIGSPIANRNRREIEGLIGFFVNTLVLRTDLSGNPTFRELLNRVRQICLGAYAHQDLPVEKLIEALRLPRDLSYTPLVQVAFAFENVPMSSLELPGLNISLLEIDTGTAKTDLTLFMQVGAEGLTAVVEYNTDLFDATTITGMLDHFQKLLEVIVTEPEQRLSTLWQSSGLMASPLTTSHVEREEGTSYRERSNLTDNQLLIWLGHQLNLDVPLYNNAATFTIPAEIVPKHFQKAFQTLVNSSDALRTVIQEIDGNPQQIVVTNFPYTVEYLDFSQFSRPSEFQAWVSKRSQVPFDFEKCLFDCVLIKLSDNKFVWYINLHQIIADGLSFSLIFRHVSILYERFLKGQWQETLKLPQFQDYIDYERAYRGSSRYFKAKTYWEQKLSEDQDPITFYGQRTLKQTMLVQRVSCDLGFERTQKLKNIAAQGNVFGNTRDTSLFNIFLALFAIYLYRISSNRHFSIGIPLRNRRLKGFKETIGSFMQVIPLQIAVQENDTILSLINQITGTTFEALRYGQYVIENPQRAPIYEVMLNYHTEEFFNFNETQVTTEWIYSGHGKESLVIQIRDFASSGNLALDFDFHKDVFDEKLRSLVIQHFFQVLDAFLEDSSQPIYRVNLLSILEKQRLLVEFNQTKIAFSEQTISQLLEAQAQKTPNQVAVVFEDQALTYAQLNAKANRLAHYLQVLGVKPEVLVGLCVERSLDMLVGLLGILKAGGAYVPLDPAYPQESLAFMVSDSQVSVLLTHEKLVSGLPEHGARVVCLDTDWGVIAQHREDNPLSVVKPDNLAYVIYTSGSTGKPKGVMIQHQSLVNFTETAIVEYGLNTRDRVLQFASISFDAAAEEIYPCLTCGGTLVLRTDEMLSSVPAFLQKCRDWELTVLDLPTAYWHQVVSELALTNLVVPESLRLVIIGGERAFPERVGMWQKCVGTQPQLVNTYGPTEATVVATMYKLPPSAPVDTTWPELPIGHPIRNIQVYVLDQYLQPVPIGVPGELHIGGAGLARGYLNRSELTEEKFIPNPFSDEPGARLYKTGDKVRYLSNGNIEFLGRLDHQVKIRGFRIELGEIEAVLTQHPAVRETVVIAQEDQLGNKRLVAYVVPNQEQVPTHSELRRFLKQKLPEYMLPSTFVMLEALPLTPNGKVERRALPAPDKSRNSLEDGFVAPRTPAEEILATIWAEVLGLEQVGIHDNFFELGGDSIISIQIIARANQAGLSLTPRQLFQHQSIVELAAVAGTTILVQAEQGLVTGSVPLTPIQHWFFEQNLPEPHHFNQSVLLEVPSDLKPELLKQVVQQLLVHHDALRLRFVRDGSIWQQINVGLEETVPFTVVDFSQLSSGEQQTALETAAAELQASLNLSEGPVMRVALFNLGINKPGRLLLVIHHLAVDGVSWRILLEDLSTAYQQLSRGGTIALPPKTTSFKDWAYRLMECLRSQKLQQELDYWLAESWSGVVPLPVDYPSSKEANTVASAAHVSVALSVEQTRSLLQEVPHAYNTQINDVLLTALVQIFAEWIGERSLLVDLEGHGREELFEDVDLSRTVGWFTTIFPVLLELGKVSHTGEALKSVKEQLHRTPNRGIGYGLLRYLSQDATMRFKLQGFPQAEVSFNYLGQLDQVLSKPPVLGLAKESSGPEHSRLGSRSHLLDVNGFVAEGRLQLDWTYSKNVHQRATVERLAQGFMEALQSLIAHCQSPEVGGYTPSDFPEAELSQEELDELLGEISLSEK
jgi:amino acid adenylation domain-containing protein/non-ribosomal peptide synthase protein (TIGR01720 family)